MIFNDDEDRWYITHSMNPFGKFTTAGSKGGPWRGLYIAGLEWSEGVPVPVDLRAVMPIEMHRAIKGLDATLLLEHFYSIEELEEELEYIDRL